VQQFYHAKESGIVAM